MAINLQEQDTGVTDPNAPDIEVKKKKSYGEWKSRLESCKSYRRKLIPDWTHSIDRRRGKPFASQTDEDRVIVNLDWSLTKSKQAALFSQVPQVHVDHPPNTQQAGPWLFAFEQRLNDTLITAGIETAMDECLPDCINAAGFGAVIISYESITEQVEVPSVDFGTLPPQMAQMILQSGKMPDGSPIPTETVPKVIDHRYVIQRISPSDLLWPITFNGADFDNAPWIGRSGRVTWAQAMNLFGLKEEDRDSVLGEDRTFQDRLTHDIEKDKIVADEMVSFDEIFYKEYLFDEAAKSYYTIHRLVFVHGKDKPVVDEPWKGQQVDDKSGLLLGAQRFPIRVLLLTYITDETIPPSDSAIARPQINELNELRTQMVLQRKRSLPIRWFNVNFIDPTIQQSLMRGTWQGMIPVQGDGSRHIGEVSRAQMPPEDFAFDKIAKEDLADLMGIGSNQQGNYDASKRSATEAQVVQQNFQARIGRERAKVGKFFTSIAEVIGGLLAIFEEPNDFGEDFDPIISKALSYSILADSTVLLDSNQRLERIIKFLNFTAKSGWVNLEPVLKEIATLSGMDPNVVIQKPAPKPPVEPNISLRLTGVEDLLNPLTLATLMKTGQAPDAQLIEEAKKLIQMVVLPPMPPQPQGPGGPGDGSDGGAPGTPPIITGDPRAQGMNPGDSQSPEQGGAYPGARPPMNPNVVPPAGRPNVPQPPAPKPGEAHPNYTYNSPIQKRTEGSE